jgi:hypothetical protein
MEQTGRTLSSRYKEHIHTIRNYSRNMKYLNHILKIGHTYGTVTNAMNVMRTGRKADI